MPNITLLKTSSVYTVGVTVEHAGHHYSADVRVIVHTSPAARPLLRPNMHTAGMAGLDSNVRTLLCKAATNALQAT